MDIGSIVATVVQLMIKSPIDGAPTGLIINLRSLEHPEVKKVTRAVQDAVLKLQRRGKPQNAEMIDENTKLILVAAVDGWEWTGEASFNGVKLDFKPDNVRKVIEVSWIADQIDSELGDTARFFRNSVTTSRKA